MTVTAARYDRVTMLFHWATAIVVFVLLGTAFGWKYLPREWHFKQYESLHVSMGILLAALVIGRILWRTLAGRKIHGAGSPVADVLSKLVHFGLYGLLIAQVGLGFTLRWVQGETFSFFGLFSIPQLIAANRGLGHQVEDLHSLVAWAVLIVVAGHTAAALFHRIVLKDRVLQRMLPIG